MEFKYVHTNLNVFNLEKSIEFYKTAFNKGLAPSFNVARRLRCANQWGIVYPPLIGYMEPAA